MNTKHKSDCKRAWRRYDKSCPRCQELAVGAPPREWNWVDPKLRDAERADEIKAHFNSERHRNGGCGPVCTFGEW